MKAEMELRKFLMIFLFLLFAFMLGDLSLTYVIIQNQLIPVINLIPLL